ncbi:hypothetical protein [Actinokineospora sp.]|uniref:hypothetical protein n=1 Tax=Actinokineospora sp. TaxID=1872133 RepID=UPI0040384C3A
MLDVDGGWTEYATTLAEGAVFCDSGGAFDDERVGFRCLLDALSLPGVAGAVALNPLHLSPRPQVVTSLVLHIRRTGCALRVRDGGLPDEAARLCAGQPELRP